MVSVLVLLVNDAWLKPTYPGLVSGNKYWAVGFYEDQTTYAHRWQSFLVRLDGKGILVDDVATGDYLGILKWREKEKPMERVRETKEP